MNRNVTQLLADAKHIALSATEKSAIRASLKQEIASSASTQLSNLSDPIGLEDAERQEGRARLISFMNTYEPSMSGWKHLFTVRLPAAAVAATFIVFTTSGTLAFAAEDTVPGDMLYSVKVHITEPLRERFIRDPDLQAEIHMRRIDRRFEEAHILMERQQFTPERREMLEQHIEERIATLERRAEETDENGSDEMRQRMEDLLAKHEALLDAVESEESFIDEVQEFTSLIKRRHDMIHTKRMKRRSNGDEPFVLPESLNNIFEQELEHLHSEFDEDIHQNRRGARGEMLIPPPVPTPLDVQPLPVPRDAPARNSRSNEDGTHGNKRKGSSHPGKNEPHDDSLELDDSEEERHILNLPINNSVTR